MFFTSLLPETLNLDHSIVSGVASLFPGRLAVDSHIASLCVTLRHLAWLDGGRRFVIQASRHVLHTRDWTLTWGSSPVKCYSTEGGRRLTSFN